MPTLRFLAPAVAALALTGCGMKGPLYLPPPKPQPTQAAQPAQPAQPTKQEPAK